MFVCDYKRMRDRQELGFQSERVDTTVMSHKKHTVIITFRTVRMNHIGNRHVQFFLQENFT